MLVNMSRPPSMSSHPGPPPSYRTYPAPHALSSQQVRPRDPSKHQNNAQQLPSLRTLLEPELLNKKFTDAALQLGGVQLAHAPCSRYGSSSPTLKRRHDYDGYAHGHPEHNAINSQTSYHHRQPLHTTHTDIQSAASSRAGSAFSASRLELQHRDSFAHVSQHDPKDKGHRLSSMTSDTVGAPFNHTMHDDYEGAGRPVRRRLDGSSRAPVRASRCIGQQDVPGEGLCYVYEDGTYCRAIIDGEPVNPSWGITKAGKPRKRLAQACLTCREKKIKCEPGIPKCQQCAKSQRVCRGALNQAGMSNASGETSPSSSALPFKNSATEAMSPAADKIGAPGEPRDSFKRIDIWHLGTPLRSHNFRPNSIAIPRDMSTHSVESDWSGSAHDQGLDDSGCGLYPDHVAQLWEQDPFDKDPRLTIHLLDLYFLHTGRATYGMFPRRPFLVWVESCRAKDQDALMLLYSLLAMGSLFSVDPEKRALGRRFAYVALHATEKRFGKFSLQLGQARLMLALYYFARGKVQESWDFCGAGLRAISALKLNTEEGIRELADSIPELDYGFDRWTYEECCRRTLWAGVLMDQQRYNGFFGGAIFVISIEDIFVRLPCPDNMYEASAPCESPFLDEELLSTQSPPGLALGDMAYSCLISSIWADVLTFTGRAARRPETGYERHYEIFYAKVYEKLESWQIMLPTKLRYSIQHLDESILGGYAGTFISIHALYHATIIRLNRHIQTHAISAGKLHRNVEQAVRNASCFLSMMHSLAAVNRHQRLPASAASDFLFPTPFAGYALLLSIDVLTSAGTFATLPNLIETISTTLSCLDDLVDFWMSTQAQQKSISGRLKQLKELAVQEVAGARNGNHGQYWKLSNSLETAFGSDDALYKIEDQLLFDVIGQLTCC